MKQKADFLPKTLGTLLLMVLLALPVAAQNSMTVTGSECAD